MTLYDRDATAARLLATRLVRDGFEPEVVDRFASFIEEIDRNVPDLLVVGLDPAGGQSQLEVLARQPRAPLIVLVWPDSDVDVADALDLGADDALDRPFSPRLFTARVRALLRRAGTDVGAGATNPVIDCGRLSIDTSSRQAYLDEQEIPLTTREFDLLTYLARNPRQVFTRGNLLGHVWGIDQSWISASTVTEHVRRIRLRIEDDPASPGWIVTVRGVGYRFEPSGATT